MAIARNRDDIVTRGPDSADRGPSNFIVWAPGGKRLDGRPIRALHRETEKAVGVLTAFITNELNRVEGRLPSPNDQGLVGQPTIADHPYLPPIRDRPGRPITVNLKRRAKPRLVQPFDQRLELVELIFLRDEGCP